MKSLTCPTIMGMTLRRRMTTVVGSFPEVAKFREIQDVHAAALWDDDAMQTTALIVDDHPSFRRFARRLLESAGYVVVGDAKDGASALEAVGTLHPDVVLLDVLLPDMTGFDVARELGRRPERPLVVLTSSRSASDLGQLLHSADAAGFIAKRDLTVAALAALVGEAA